MSPRQQKPGWTGARFTIGYGVFLCLLTTAASSTGAQTSVARKLVRTNAFREHVQPGEIVQSGEPAQGATRQASPAAQNSAQPAAGAALTLEQARQLALANHPQLRAAQFSAAAAHQRVIEQRAAYFPTVAGDLTGVKSDDGRIAAGSLNNPVIFSRFAAGVGVQQLATDFGRTRNLVASARLSENAENANVDASRADVLLTVDRAYYAALRAQAVLGVAQQTVNDRDVVAQQIHALFQSKLKSGLDVSFADVNLAQAKMLLAQAQNDADAATADLTRALGFADSRTYKLAEPPTVAAELPDLNGALAEADRDRPDLIAQRYQAQSSQRFATAERDLFFPTLAIAGAAGEVPFGETQLPQNYGAIGFDVHIPIFNGRLFNARHSEAEDRARQAQEELRNVEIGVAHDVRDSITPTIFR